MRKRKSWRVFRWVGVLGLGAWLGMYSVPGAQAQPPEFDSLHVGSTWWWGDLDNWTLDGEEALWFLDATSNGPHVLCGCQATTSNSDQVAVHWRQQVYGSSANRSELFFAALQGDDAVDAARQCSLSALGDSLTSGVRLSAGESGSSDSLRVEHPNAPPLALGGTCHDWASPFELEGRWRPFGSDEGSFDLQDEAGRSLRVVQHGFDAEADMLCLGIKVTRTASHGQRWAFGWHLEPSSSSQVGLKLTLEGPQSVHALASGASELGPPEVFLHQEWTSSQPQPQDAQTEVAGVQSLVHWAPGSCSNTWSTTLPQPLAPGETAQFSHLEDTLVVWRDGSSLLVQGDLAFTEVMADPTPAMHAPESTYLELVNLSSHAFDPTALWLEDSGEFHTLSWPEGAHARPVPPGACWLVVDDAGPWPLGDGQPIVVKAAGWSGLRDEGESVAMVGPQGELERVTFHEGWWNDTPQDGVSASILSPLSCDHPSTWMPDPSGASPGRLAWPGHDPELPEVHSPLILWVDDRLRLHLKPHLAWDTRTAPTVHVLDDSIQRAFRAIPHAHDDWRLEDFQARPGSKLHVHVDEVPACHHPWRTLPMDTIWTAHRPAQPGDIRLSELLSEHHPVVGAEFVEWLNVSGDTLAWGQTCWPPGQTLVESTLPKSHFASWIPTDWLDHPGLWTVRNNLRLTNSAGRVTLHRPDGLTVASSSYSECGFSRPEDVGQGKSAVLRDRGWSTSNSPWGMSPGWLEHQVDSTPILQPIQPRWGIHEGHWLMVLPAGMDEKELHPGRWSPTTDWELDWLHGLRVIRSLDPRKPGSPPPFHKSHAAWSFPMELEQTSDPSLIVARWNEVLAHPIEGHDTFLEVLTQGHPGNTSSWFWSSKDWPEADDFTPVSEVIWHVSAHTPICFAQCPARIQASHASCLPGNLPSLHGSRNLSLLAGGALDEVASPEGTAEDPTGRSWMRVGDTPAWGIAPERPGSTPGAANIQVASAPSPSSGSRLSCLTNTLAPFGTHGPSTALFQWEASEDASHVLVVQHGVLDPGLGEVVFQDETWAWEGRATWSWDGTSSDGNLVDPGTYVVWAQPLVDGARQSVEKCLVAVRGR